MPAPANMLRGNLGHGRGAPAPVWLLNARANGVLPYRPCLWWGILFEPRDLWIGVYWKRPDVAWRYALDLYVCVVPMLPVLLSLRWAGWNRPRPKYLARKVRSCRR